MGNKKNINLVREFTESYGQVQDNIFAQISTHIEPDKISQTKRKILTDKATINLSFFIRNKADVIMSHGVADKNYLFIKDEHGGPLVHKFSHVLVPGPWLKNRLLEHDDINLKKGQIHIVGWPRLDALIELRKKVYKKSAIDKIKRKLSTKNKFVVWAPTHNNIDTNVKIEAGQQETPSSYPKLMEFADKLEEQFDFHKALHPRNKDKDDKPPTTELLAKADVVISDMGTMVYEAWALGIPVVFPSWLVKDFVIQFTPGSAEAYIYENGIGLHANSFEEMCEMLKNANSLGQDVINFMEEYLPSKFLGCSGARIASLLSHLVK